MRRAILGFVAGAAWLQTQPDLPGRWALLALAAALLALVLTLRRYCRFAAQASPLSGWMARRDETPPLLGAGLAVCGALAGFVWAALMAHQHLREDLPPEWEGRDITVVGTIDSLPHRFERGIRFNFAVERVLADAGTDGGADAAAGEEGGAQEPTAAAALPVLPSRLALSWYGGWRGADAQAAPDVLPGERWQLTLRLRRPHGNANPHGFDYEVWLLEQGLRATGYVRPDRRSPAVNRKLDDFVPGFSNAVERSRHWLRERILAALPGKEYAGVIVALVVGDQRAIAHGE